MRYDAYPEDRDPFDDTDEFYGIGSEPARRPSPERPRSQTRPLDLGEGLPEGDLGNDDTYYDPKDRPPRRPRSRAGRKFITAAVVIALLGGGAFVAKNQILDIFGISDGLKINKDVDFNTPVLSLRDVKDPQVLAKNFDYTVTDRSGRKFIPFDDRTTKLNVRVNTGVWVTFSDLGKSCSVQILDKKMPMTNEDGKVVRKGHLTILMRLPAPRGPASLNDVNINPANSGDKDTKQGILAFTNSSRPGELDLARQAQQEVKDKHAIPTPEEIERARVNAGQFIYSVLGGYGGDGVLDQLGIKLALHVEFANKPLNVFDPTTYSGPEYKCTQPETLPIQPPQKKASQAPTAPAPSAPTAPPAQPSTPASTPAPEPVTA